MKVFNVFIASPGDVSPERDIVEEVVHDINAFCREAFGIEFEVKRWEISATPTMGNPQGNIVGSTDLGNCDIFIGLLWKRFGTMTGNKNPETGQPFQSGTEEEFYIAYKLFEKHNRPVLLWYQKRVKPGGARHAEKDQLQKVGQFIARFSADGPNPGLVKPFNTTDEFRRMLTHDLSAVTGKLIRGEMGRSISLINREGFQHLYLPEDRGARNTSKQNAIQASMSVDLQAFHGHSFLAVANSQFRKDVEELVTVRRGTFRAVILNPWSECSLRMALAYDENQRPQMFCPLESLSFEEARNAILSSPAYRFTFQSVKEGYRILKKAAGTNLDVRITDGAFESTYLVTNETVYFEPYQISSIDDRAKRSMSTFEIAAERNSRFGDSLAADFEYRWKNSVPLSKLIENETPFIEQFKGRFAR